MTDAPSRRRLSLTLVVITGVVLTSALALHSIPNNSRAALSVGVETPSPPPVLTAEPTGKGDPAMEPDDGFVRPAIFEARSAEEFHNVRLCGADQPLGACGPGCNSENEVKPIMGVNAQCGPRGREPLWKQQQLIPWESFAYGEYIGPYRTPHVATYQLRVNDQLEFTFFQVREPTGTPYRLYVGDIIEITSTEYTELNQPNLIILPDGTVSLRQIGRVRAAGRTVDQLAGDLNGRYEENGIKEPQIVVRVTQADTPLRDIRDAVDARQGSGGQTKVASVSPDGTVQLPLVNSVPAIGLSLDELGREVNARYRQFVRGLDVTARLVQPAPRFVYVLGEVKQPGKVQVTSPTTVIQAISQAGGWNQGGNLRQVVVFRRDQDWRMMATRLNLSGALAGARPMPPDDIWLRDSDIVLVPKMPVQRLSELIDLYFTRTAYSVFKFQGYDVLFNGTSVIGNSN